MRLVAAGVPIEVECDDETVANELRHAWSRCLLAGVEAEPQVTVRVSESGDAAARMVLTRVTSEAIRASAGSRLMFHGAALADDRDLVVALVGPSGSGKTTAAMRLGSQRFAYVTDETVSVGLEGDVAPFARPLATALDGSAKKAVLAPDDLKLRQSSEHLTLARMVLLDRRDVVDGASAKSLPTVVDAALALIPHISALAMVPNPLRSLCALLERSGGLVRLTFADIDDEVGELLERLVVDPPGSVESWDATSLPRREDVALNLGMRDHRVRQGAVLDGVASLGEGLLLVEGKPVRLAGIGLTIWEAAADAPTFQELVERVVAEHGPHPEAEALVREAVDSMVEAKVLGYGSPMTVQQFLASMAPQLAAASDNACNGGGA